MKKRIFLATILGILIGAGIAVADNLDSQIQLKETQLQSIQWEFRYLQERVTTLQSQGQKLQVEIDALKKQKEEKKAESKGKDK